MSRCIASQSLERIPILKLGELFRKHVRKHLVDRRHIGALLDEDHTAIELERQLASTELVRALREPQEHKLELLLLLVTVDELSKFGIQLVTLHRHVVVQTRL